MVSVDLKVAAPRHRHVSGFEIRVKNGALYELTNILLF